MKTKADEKVMGWIGRGMMALTLVVGASLWMGSARNDHRAVTDAKASTIERIALVNVGIHYADADKDTLDLQLD